MKAKVNEDCVTVETAEALTQDDQETSDCNVADEASAEERNDLTASFREFQGEMNRRIASRESTLPLPGRVPNVRRTSMTGSIHTFESVGSCLSDGNDEGDENLSEMMLQISNHYETPHKDVAASLKSFQVDMDYVKNGEEEHHQSEDDSDEDFSEALSFAEDSVESRTPEPEKKEVPSKPTTQSDTVDTSFPPAPPLTNDGAASRKMDYSRLSLKALKVELQVCGVSTAGFLEKPDFVKALEDHKQDELKSMNSTCSDHRADSESCITDSPETPIKYVTNEKVLYISGDGKEEAATIVKVHLDDELVPFYDIRLNSSGREKQTDDAHLSPLPARKSKSRKRTKAPPKRSSTTSVRSSTEYSYTSDTGYSLTSDNLSRDNLLAPNLQYGTDGIKLHSVQKPRLVKAQSLDGLSLSAHPVLSQRSTEGTHRRSSTGAVPKAIPQPRRKASSVRRIAKSTEQAGRTRSSKPKKKRSMDGLSLSAHATSSQRSTEQPQRRTSCNPNPNLFLSPNMQKKKQSMDGLSLSTSTSKRSSEEPRRRISLKSVNTRARKNDDLSQSWHPVSSRNSAVSQWSRGEKPRRPLTPTPESFVSPVARGRKNVGLDLSMHSANPRLSVEQPPRRSAISSSIPPSLFLTPGAHAGNTNVKKKRGKDGLSVSAHAATSQRLSSDQPRRQSSLISANARDLSQSLHSASSKKSAGANRKAHSKSRRSSSSSQRRTSSRQGSIERHPSKLNTNYGTPPQRKRSSKPKKSKSLSVEVPRSAPATSRRSVSSNGIPKFVILDLSTSPSPPTPTVVKSKSTPFGSMLSKAKKLVKVG